MMKTKKAVKESSPAVLLNELKSSNKAFFYIMSKGCNYFGFITQNNQDFIDFRNKIYCSGNYMGISNSGKFSEAGKYFFAVYNLLDKTLFLKYGLFKERYGIEVAPLIRLKSEIDFTHNRSVRPIEKVKSFLEEILS